MCYNCKKLCERYLDSRQQTADSRQQTAIILTKAQAEARELILNKYISHRNTISSNNPSVKSVSIFKKSYRFMKSMLRYPLAKTGLLAPAKRIKSWCSAWVSLSRPYTVNFGSDAKPYQSFPMLDIDGLRSTDMRIRTYRMPEVLNKDMDILDIGCNIGFFDMTIAEHVRSVYGIEYDKALVDIANFSAETLGIKNVEFVHGDFNEWIKENTRKFDAVLSFAVHVHMRISPEKYFNFLSSLIKPNGYLYFETNHIEAVRDDAAYRKVKTERGYLAEIIRLASLDGFVKVYSGGINDGIDENGELIMPREWVVLHRNI